jgi:sugar phosphate isomerase/epimerase
MNYSRTEFLKLAGLTGVASLASPFVSAKEIIKNDTALQLGLASYSLRNFKIDDVIKMMQRLGLKSISLKSMHLPLESSAEDIRAVAEKLKAGGLSFYGAGVIYMKSPQEVEQTFSYAAAAGLEMIIGVPNHELLPQVNEAVKKFNIKLAIHNHGPGDNLYRSVTGVYDKIKDLDKRIGLCIDIGHVVRIGEDPVAMITKYKDRLYDLHMKDVSSATEKGDSIEIGRGVIDIPGVIKALKKINYKGVLALEFEKDGSDPMPGLSESVGYTRGIIKMS